MRDVFICHAEEDRVTALGLATGLRAAGFTTWCYEEDSDPGPSYLRQVDEELASTQAVVVVLSSAALASPTVVSEVVRAHEARKPFIPLRRGLTHEAVQKHAELRMALGASVSMEIDGLGVEEYLPRVIRGLQRIGVQGTGSAQAVPIRSPAPSPTGGSPGPRLARAIDGVSDATRIGITTVVGTLGVIGSLANLLNAINPDGQTAALYRVAPAIGTATVWASAFGLGVNAILLFSMWQLFARREPVSARIRLVTALLLMSIVVWLVVVVFAALFPRYPTLRGADRLSVISASVLVAALAAGPAALVRALFRR